MANRRNSKGAAGAAISELDIVGVPTAGGAIAPQTSAPPAEPEVPPASGEGNGAHVDADLDELDAALGGAGHGEGGKSGADGGGEQALPTPHSPLVSVPSRQPRRRRRSSGVQLRVELNLPEEVTTRAKASVRPRYTGLRRSKGQSFVLEAYVMAVDDLIGGAGRFDLEGVETVEDMVERVKAALAEELAVDREAAESAAA